MRLLITGVAGFAGSYLATHLFDTDIEIYGASRESDILMPQLRDRVTYLQGDLLSGDYVRDMLTQVKPDVIVHLAGQPFVPTAWSNPWGTIELNVLPQLHMLKGLIDLGLTDTRFLSITSGKVYGHALPERIPFHEDDHFDPDNPYDLSKVTQDLMASQYYLSHKLPIVRARPFNHIGPRQNANFVTGAFARQIARIEAGVQDPIMHVGNLSVARDFSDVRDVVRAYALLMLHGKAGEAYNIGSGRAVTIQHILDTLLSFSNVDINIEQDESKMRPTDQPISYGVIEKIKKDVGWQPEIPLEQSLKDILNYWRAEIKSEN